MPETAIDDTTRKSDRRYVIEARISEHTVYFDRAKDDH